jgi:hypothetical protein
MVRKRSSVVVEFTLRRETAIGSLGRCELNRWSKRNATR